MDYRFLGYLIVYYETNYWWINYGGGSLDDEMEKTHAILVGYSLINGREHYSATPTPISLLNDMSHEEICRMAMETERKEAMLDIEDYVVK